MTAPSALATLIADFQADRMLANHVLFAHRHPNDDAPFHARMVRGITSQAPRVLMRSFRGSAKSTIAEECLTTEAVFNLCQFGLIIGATYDDACMRLASIKHELDHNKKLGEMFGGLRGSTWGEDVILLSNGVRLEAMGYGQTLRGAKEVFKNMRPDFVLIDDLEDTDSVATVPAREKVWRWFNRVLLPALDPNARIRMAGTPLHEQAAVERLAANPDWITITVPIWTEGEGGKMVSNWPSRFSVAAIEKIQRTFENAGDLAGFSQEYLCKPIDNAARTFSSSMIVMDTNAPRWAPRIVVVDPARTTNATSSLTGYVVGSWVGSDLYLHDGYGGMHMPSEQVDNIVQLNEVHQPMTIAVEADGLEEWIMQPLRAATSKTGITLPIVGIRAPRDKKQFITGLQPFFKAHEIKFTKSLPELEAQLLSFPFGKLDIINALAYLIKLRPGAPVYPGFTAAHMRHFLPATRASMWVALNATAGTLVAVLVAVQDGCMHVVKDWVYEGPTEDSLRKVRVSISAMAQEVAAPQFMIPAERAVATDYAGLGNALRRHQIQFRTGRKATECVESLTPLLRSYTGSATDFTVSPDATWTLNALAGGYARQAERGNVLLMTPTENIHACVAQAVEVLAGTLDPARNDSEAAGLEYAQTSTGRRYVTMRRTKE